MLISPRSPAEGQALRDWGDFVHIRDIAAASPDHFTMITPYENRAAGPPRYMHFYELDTDDPEPAFRQMAPTTMARAGAYATHPREEWWGHEALVIDYVNTFRRHRGRRPGRPDHRRQLRRTRRHRAASRPDGTDPAGPTPYDPAMVRVDAEGELYSAPSWLTYVWVVLAVLTLLEAVNEIFGIGGPSDLYEVWFHDLVIAAAAVLILARAVYEPRTRKAWLAFGSGMVVWCVGSIAWSIAYGSHPHVPTPRFADVLWLLWYPFMAAGMVYLIRFRITGFELHRWLDGIAVTLVVLAAGFALVVQPAADHTAQGLLATIVSFGYPVLDVILIGAILGVYGLLGLEARRHVDPDRTGHHDHRHRGRCFRRAGCPGSG